MLVQTVALNFRTFGVVFENDLSRKELVLAASSCAPLLPDDLLLCCKIGTVQLTGVLSCHTLGLSGYRRLLAAQLTS